MLCLYEQSLFAGALPMKLTVHNIEVTDSSTIDYSINGYPSAISGRDENIVVALALVGRLVLWHSKAHFGKGSDASTSTGMIYFTQASRGDVQSASYLEVYYVSGDVEVLFDVASDKEWDQGKGEDDKEIDSLNPYSDSIEGEEGNHKEGSGEPKDDNDNFSEK
ncbi:hypothetical protein NE237_015836 [Protea cynaroides]|uniref:Uncharacterized protein n=1 Tax=Protea cynaroides TaxID=273540 RepID=A0A9Q0QRG1_9MAGN|nr:hypothetical protein NE237_015836 [Protea cynaroides]